MHNETSMIKLRKENKLGTNSELKEFYILVERDVT